MFGPPDTTLAEDILTSPNRSWVHPAAHDSERLLRKHLTQTENERNVLALQVQQGMASWQTMRAKFDEVQTKYINDREKNQRQFCELQDEIKRLRSELMRARSKASGNGRNVYRQPEPTVSYTPPASNNDITPDPQAASNNNTFANQPVSYPPDLSLSRTSPELSSNSLERQASSQSLQSTVSSQTGYGTHGSMHGFLKIAYAKSLYPTKLEKELVKMG